MQNDKLKCKNKGVKRISPVEAGTVGVVFMVDKDYLDW